MSSVRHSTGVAIFHRFITPSRRREILLETWKLAPPPNVPTKRLPNSYHSSMGMSVASSRARSVYVLKAIPPPNKTKGWSPCHVR